MPAFPEDKLPRNDVRHAAVAADPIRVLAEPLIVMPKALKMFKDLERDVVRVLGAAHPFTDDVQYNRKATEAKLFHSNFGGSGGS